MDKKLGFIGAGNMATAIINGIIKKGAYKAQDICIFDLSEDKKEKMSKLGIEVAKSASAVFDKSSFVVLAVKPQNYEEVLNDVKNSVKCDHVIVSIAAGISIGYIKERVSGDCAVVRVMPNTPLLLGEGATAVCGSEGISKEKFALACELFSSSGIVEVLSEDKMNEVIAINGSSPAYIYLFAKAMKDYSDKCGIDSKASMSLICQTLKGSAKMLLESEYTPDELIKMVSSPGGTTLAALKTLEQKGFYDSIVEAMESCTKRADELSK